MSTQHHRADLCNQQWWQQSFVSLVTTEQVIRLKSPSTGRPRAEVTSPYPYPSPSSGSCPLIRQFSSKAIPCPWPPPWAWGKEYFPGCRWCLPLLVGCCQRSSLFAGAFFLWWVMTHQCIASCSVTSFLNQCSYFQGLCCYLTLILCPVTRDTWCHVQSTQQADNKPNRLDWVPAELTGGTVSISLVACN